MSFTLNQKLGLFSTNGIAYKFFKNEIFDMYERILVTYMQAKHKTKTQEATAHPKSMNLRSKE